MFANDNTHSMTVNLCQISINLFLFLEDHSDLLTDTGKLLYQMVEVTKLYSDPEQDGEQLDSTLPDPIVVRFLNTVCGLINKKKAKDEKVRFRFCTACVPCLRLTRNKNSE